MMIGRSLLLKCCCKIKAYSAVSTLASVKVLVDFCLHCETKLFCDVKLQMHNPFHICRPTFFFVSKDALN